MVTQVSVLGLSTSNGPGNGQHEASGKEGTHASNSGLRAVLNSSQRDLRGSPERWGQDGDKRGFQRKREAGILFSIEEKRYLCHCLLCVY